MPEFILNGFKYGITGAVAVITFIAGSAILSPVAIGIISLIGMIFSAKEERK